MHYFQFTFFLNNYYNIKQNITSLESYQCREQEVELNESNEYDLWIWNPPLTWSKTKKEE